MARPVQDWISVPLVANNLHPMTRSDNLPPSPNCMPTW